ncbi:MAG: hypothetical protein AABZ12_03680 [Planctomycetota bacterium]
MTNSISNLRERFPIGQRTLCLIRLASGADSGMEIAEFLRFVLGFVQVADGAEAVVHML